MNIRKELFTESPYRGFDFRKYPHKVEGWGSDRPLFKRLIAELRPTTVIEVGTWKGGSAITMGKAVAELGLKTEIVCVDTWLGALEFWLDKTDEYRYISLDLRNGYPQVYYQFLANVMHERLEEIITPFPQASVIAARWFKLINAKAQLIYIDGSHDEPDVYQDLVGYWDIVEKGGIMFGDDYATQYWPGVVNAVDRFAKERKLVLEVDDAAWILKKNS